MSTEDYFIKINQMPSEKLHEEEKRIYDLLFRMSEASPMFAQLQDMLDQVQEVKHELQVRKQYENARDQVIDIGKIEEVVYTPNYSSDELMTAVVQLYLSKKETKR